MNRRTGRRALLVGLVLTVLAVARWVDAPAGAPEGSETGAAVVAEAFENRRSGVWVEVAGEVDRRLADDNRGDRHQRFVLRLEDGATLLVAHNIDLAERVPLAEGDRVRLRGRYEWNERGGVVHWTHHDPDGGSAGVWIVHAGETYR